jgi:homoserine dehydrogenase
MRTQPLKVALLGCGAVGTEVAQRLLLHGPDLAARAGTPLELIGIAVRRPGRPRAPEIDPALFTTHAATLVSAADIVVEVIGGIEPARTLILAAMENGASVVTANKALLAEDGPTLYEAADKHGVDLYYEASVAGAIPLLRPLRESLAGDKVYRIVGIVNGTTNYILSRMDGPVPASRRHSPRRPPWGTRRGRPDRRRRRLRRARQGRDPRFARVSQQGDRRGRAPRGHHRVSAADVVSAREMGCVVKLLAIPLSWPMVAAALEYGCTRR